MDVFLEILSNRYRRRLLVALLEHNPQDDEDTQLPADVRYEGEELKRYRMLMTHTHLPKLDEAGLIEWDPEKNAVRVGPRFDEIRPLLELMHTHADELPDGWL
jgi:hypothetical protein